MAILSFVFIGGGNKDGQLPVCLQSAAALHLDA
jgi:hypothetical protein